MNSLEFPTRNGICVPIQDIWLPESELNPNKPKNYNNHHFGWVAYKFGRCLLYQVFRDLQCNQEVMLIDQHNYVHAEYDEPKPPSPLQARELIEREYQTGGYLKIKHNGHYSLRDIDDNILSQVDECYNQLKG